MGFEAGSASDEGMKTIAVVVLLAGALGCRHARPIPMPAVSRAPSVIEHVPPPGAKSAGVRATESASTSMDSPRSATESASNENPLQEINRVLEDAFFDFDRYQLRDDAIESLRRNARQLALILERQSGLMLIVEGHCDELGSAEYNLALGDRRAEVAREFLVQLGIPANRLRTVTWGKERPVCTEQTEACRQRNRRAHVMYSE